MCKCRISDGIDWGFVSLSWINIRTDHPEEYFLARPRWNLLLQSKANESVGSRRWTEIISNNRISMDGDEERMYLEDRSKTRLRPSWNEYLESKVVRINDHRKKIKPNCFVIKSKTRQTQKTPTSEEGRTKSLIQPREKFAWKDLPLSSHHITSYKRRRKNHCCPLFSVHSTMRWSSVV